MRPQRGFSLLELLVVLAIAGLMTGLAVAWLDSGKASVDQALQRLAAHVHTQAALARHAGQLRGLRWTGQHPEFVRREREGWVAEP
ncbi:type II secretion system protein GspH, partial [Pseudomonas sp. SG-MS2]